MDRMDNEDMDDENHVNEANAEDEEDKQNWSPIILKYRFFLKRNNLFELQKN